jgi:tRNA/tmRNA/rRNA uracil-C5-methylase (TrmA/RlmC/RlmD family)
VTAVELELEITGVAHGGSFVGRHEGRVVFVRHTLPGERVRVRVTGTGGGGKFLRADAVEILRAAPGRVDPPCPFSGPGRCGGCDFQHISLPVQRELKAGVVTEQLSRLAGITRDVTVEFVPGAGRDDPDDGLGWRTRLQLATTGGGSLGLREHASHQVIAITDCPIAHPLLGVPALARRRWPEGSEVGVELDSRGRRWVEINRVRQPGSPHHLVQEAAGRSWRVHGGGFWQVHPGAADTLVEAVRAALSPRPGESLLDLYSGAGLFAGALAPDLAGGRIIAVEGDPDAAADARRNLRDLPAVTVVTGAVDAVLGDLVPADLAPDDVAPDDHAPDDHAPDDLAPADAGGAGGRSDDSDVIPPEVDLVVLDPPRTGAGADVVLQIAARAPRAIAYVACDPAALARDLASFAAAGYDLRGLRAFDLFPMTHHVECVALLGRAGRSGRPGEVS